MESRQLTAKNNSRRETPCTSRFRASRPSTPNQLNVNSQPRTIARLADFEYLCSQIDICLRACLRSVIDTSIMALA